MPTGGVSGGMTKAPKSEVAKKFALKNKCCKEICKNVDSFCESSDSSRIVCINFDSKSFTRIWIPNPELYKGSFLSFHKILFESWPQILKIMKDFDLFSQIQRVLDLWPRILTNLDLQPNSYKKIRLNSNQSSVSKKCNTGFRLKRKKTKKIWFDSIRNESYTSPFSKKIFLLKGTLAKSNLYN